MKQIIIGHRENHHTDRIGWLRAAVLGANDGIISTASLMVGVTASNASRGEVLVAGVAGLVAGAMSMAAGEYVSVSSQSDTEQADLRREREELRGNSQSEHQELANIYVARGLEPPLANQVASQLMAHNALESHARDELGISETTSARPTQAALTSAVTFALGAAMPLLAVILAPTAYLLVTIGSCSLILLAVLGALGALVGGAPIGRAARKGHLLAALALGLTALVGSLFGAIG